PPRPPPRASRWSRSARSATACASRRTTRTRPGAAWRTTTAPEGPTTWASRMASAPSAWRASCRPWGERSGHLGRERLHARAALDVGALLGEDLLDGEDAAGQLLEGDGAHVAQAENLALHVVLAAGDDHVVLLLERLAHLGVVDARGDLDGGDGVAAVARRHEELQPHGLERGAGGLRLRAHLGDAALEALRLDDIKRLGRGEVERDGGREGRVVLGGLLHVAQQVEVVAVLLVHRGLRALVHGHEDEAAGHAEALLRAHDGDVHAPPVHGHVHAPDARDAVRDDERAVVVRDLRDLLQRVREADAALVVREEDGLGLRRGHRALDLREVHGLAPRRLDDRRVAVGGRQRAEAVAELAVVQRDGLLALPEERERGRVHARGARARERDDRGLRLEDGLHALLDAAVDLDEGRVAVRDRGHAH